MPRRFLFEHKKQPLLPYELFLKRMLNSVYLSVSILVVTIGTGAVAFHSLEKQAWMDAFLNAVTIMSGLGLQGELHTAPGKLFTIVFALLSAFVFYSALAILFTPLLHRFLHHFHLDQDNK